VLLTRVSFDGAILLLEALQLRALSNVSSILNKLGYTSRAQIAAWPVNKRLT
jgi:hypothetical protein